MVMSLSLHHTGSFCQRCSIEGPFRAVLTYLSGSVIKEEKTTKILNKQKPGKESQLDRRTKIFCFQHIQCCVDVTDVNILDLYSFAYKLTFIFMAWHIIDLDNIMRVLDRYCRQVVVLPCLLLGTCCFSATTGKHILLKCIIHITNKTILIFVHTSRDTHIVDKYLPNTYIFTNRVRVL